MENFTDEIFSNVGVWGLNGEPLEVSIQQEVDQLVIYLNSKQREFLNISAIEVYSLNNENIIFSHYVKGVEISSDYFDKSNKSDVLSRIRKRQLLHSRFEFKPFIKIYLKESVYVEKVCLFNRTGFCGLRSRFLEIDSLNRGELVSHYSTIDPDEILRLRDELISLLEKFEGEISVPKTSFYAQKYIRNIVFQLLEKGEYVSDELQRALLPVNRSSLLLDDFTVRYISEFIDFKIHASKKLNFPTRELAQFISILSTDVSLDALTKFVSAYLTKKYGTPKKVVIAKHRVHLDTLASNKDKLLDFLDRIFGALNSMGGIPMLSYGTLLGALRDEAFISTDDDLDIIFHIDDVPPEQRDVTKASLLTKLQNAGFSVIARKNCPHITVNFPIYAIGVDIFLSWGSSGSQDVEVVMAQLKYCKLSREILLPTSTIRLYGRSYHAPARPDEFLEHRYGSGWKRKNPYHEWSWPLTQLAYFNDQSVASCYEKRKQFRPFRYSNNKTNIVAWSQCVNINDRPPYNSIPMIEQALDANFDVIEVDIRTTKDNKVVLTHDDIITNHLGQKITLSQTNFDVATDFCIGEYKGHKVTIPSLKEVLKLVGNKRVLLDARFKPKDYIALRECIDECQFDASKLIFCVYNNNQIAPLISEFPESVLLWKFYTQAWEISEIELYQLSLMGIDGIMYMYPHYDEDIKQSLFNIRKYGLQSLCFIHGQNWTPPSSCGLNSFYQKRQKDNYDASLRNMVALGIDYVTTIDTESPTFQLLTELK